MKIKVFIQKKETVEFEVDFPIYRSQVLDNSTIYTKIESENRQISIHLYDDDVKVEVEISKPYFYGSEDYLLGKREYHLAEDEFTMALNKAKEIISSIELKNPG